MSPRIIIIVALALAGCDGSEKASSRATAAAAVQPAAPILAGRVTHAGAPVAGAFVVLASKATGEAPEVDPAALFTDAAGTFRVSVPADVYDVIVVGEGGLVAEAQADVTRGATLDLALRPFEVSTDAVGRGALEALLAPLPLEPSFAEGE
jgi:hypothetical protein